MEIYLFSKAFYLHAGLFIGGTVIFLLMRKIIPSGAAGFAKRLKIQSGPVRNFSILTKRFLKLLYIVFVLKLIISIPVIVKYAKPVLDYAIVDVETFRLSISSVVKGLIVFYLLLVATRLLIALLQMYLSHKSAGEEIVSNIDLLIYNIALIFIIILTLSVVGISWKILLPLAGGLGIGIGFGIRDVVNNFVSGFVILTSRTVKRGDWITLGDYFGKIVDIGIRTSTLRTVENIDIIIPNSDLITQELTNWSYTDNIVRVSIPVGVSYSSDVPLVRETLLGVAKTSQFVLNSPAPEARFLEFGNSSLDFALLVWVDIKKIKIPLLKSLLNYAIWDAFKEKGIQIPFPQRDIWFRNALHIEKE